MCWRVNFSYFFTGAGGREAHGDQPIIRLRSGALGPSRQHEREADALLARELLCLGAAGLLWARRRARRTPPLQSRGPLRDARRVTRPRVPGRPRAHRSGDQGGCRRQVRTPSLVPPDDARRPVKAELAMAFSRYLTASASLGLETGGCRERCSIRVLGHVVPMCPGRRERARPAAPASQPCWEVHGSVHAAEEVGTSYRPRPATRCSRSQTCSA